MNDRIKNLDGASVKLLFSAYHNLNYTKEKDINRYVDTLRNFYNIKKTIIQADYFDIKELNTDDVIQIIPQEKNLKFEKSKFTILQIEV